MARDFYFLQSIQNGFEIHPASYPAGTAVSFRGFMWLRRKAEQSFNVKVKNLWRNTSIPAIHFQSLVFN
jgi:hypothetical protein